MSISNQFHYKLWESIPRELKVKIFQMCSVSDIHSAQIVSRTFANVTFGKEFWDNYFVSAFRGNLAADLTYKLAILYFKAQGRASEMGRQLVEIATTKGCPDADYDTALFNLQITRQIGNSPSQKVLELLTRTASHGHQQSQLLLAQYYLEYGDYENAYPLLFSCAHNDDTIAQREFGLHFTDEKYLMLAANKGDVKAFIGIVKLKRLLPEEALETTDVEGLKFDVGIALANSYFGKAPASLEEAKNILSIEQQFFSKFSEVCLGFLFQSKKNAKKLTKEEKKDFAFLKSYNMSIAKRVFAACQIVKSSVIKDEKKVENVVTELSQASAMSFKLGIYYLKGTRDREQVLYYFDKLLDAAVDTNASLSLVLEFMKKVKKSLPKKDTLNAKLKEHLVGKITKF